MTLKGQDFNLPVEELKEAFSSKTKAIVRNSPHNPTGKVFLNDELKVLSNMIVKNDIFVISDGVYEFLTFDDHRHIPIASLPGMRERTITISSAGKTFSFTGWKIGWCLAREHLTRTLRMVHQFNTFGQSSPSPNRCFKDRPNRLDDYLVSFRESYRKNVKFFMMV